jgi:hypothetical protein
MVSCTGRSHADTLRRFWESGLVTGVPRWRLAGILGRRSPDVPGLRWRTRSMRAIVQALALRSRCAKLSVESWRSILMCPNSVTSQIGGEVAGCQVDCRRSHRYWRYIFCWRQACRIRGRSSGLPCLYSTCVQRSHCSKRTVVCI